ncbi:MAG: ATP-grasp domain-containing protein, partial [Calditrichaeota bacterium]
MKVLVLAGGDSNERTVSLSSGKAVFDALKRLGHIAYALDPSSGKSLLGSDGSFIEFKKDDSGRAAAPTKSSGWSLAKTLGSPAFQDIEIVFITLHGGSGENGKLQCLLEIAGKKHTGSDMAASAIAMDKATSKRLCVSEKIKTPKFEVYHISNKDITDELLAPILKKFKFPFIVKPNDGGSTLGLSKVDSESELVRAIEKAASESTHVIIEEFIAGREITAAVLQGKKLPLVEIVPNSGLYDYEAKYTKGSSEYFVPADISEELTEAIQEAAVKIYNIIGCSGLARAD